MSKEDLGKNALNKTKKLLMPVVDRILQFIAAVFVIATSYKYVQYWLATHKISQDGSVAAGIMVVAVALYLIFRKR